MADLPWAILCNAFSVVSAAWAALPAPLCRRAREFGNHQGESAILERPRRDGRQFRLAAPCHEFADVRESGIRLNRPCSSRRFVEQQRAEPPFRVSQQEQARQPQRQHRFSCFGGDLTPCTLSPLPLSFFSFRGPKGRGARKNGKKRTTGHRSDVRTSTVS